jgi:hypothetical protein
VPSKYTPHGNRRDQSVTGREITVFNNPAEMMDTQYGYISFSVWIEKEAKRLGALGEKVTRIMARDGRIALTR